MADLSSRDARLRDGRVGPKVLITHNTSHYLWLHYRRLIEELAGSGCAVTVAAPLDDSARHLAGIGVRCRPLKVSRRGMSPAREIATILRYRRLLGRERPDVLFNFSIKPVIYAGLASRMFRPVDVFSMITGLGYVFTGTGARAGTVRRLALGMYRHALAGNRRVLFQNAGDRDLFVQTGLVRPERSVVVPGTGVDLQAYAPKDPGAVEPNTFLMVARLLADKGVLEFCRAAERLKKSYPGARFRLLGPYDDHPSALAPAQLARWFEAGIVEYLGAVDDVRPHLRRNAVFVLPSYREGLPRATVEAMATGMPIITTDAPGCRETVIDGDNGIIVPVRDADRLASAMQSLLDAPERIRVMGAHSRRMAEEHYDVEMVTRRIMVELGRSVLPGLRRQAPERPLRRGWRRLL